MVPGWPGSLSTKWLNRVQVRETPHDGQGMGGTSYRVPIVPIVPGSNNDGKTFRDVARGDLDLGDAPLGDAPLGDAPHEAGTGA